MFEESTQNRHWMFGKDELALKRKEVLEQAIVRVLEQQRSTIADAKHLQEHLQEQEKELRGAVDVEGCQLLLKYTELKMVEYAKRLKVDRVVQATAFALFKRFYVHQSVLEHDAHLMAVTALFLATKVESSDVSLHRFLSVVNTAVEELSTNSNNNANKKSASHALNAVSPASIPSAEQMVALEFTLSRGVRFEYSVHHSFWPLHGLFLDVQAFVIETHGKPTSQAEAFGLLQQLNVHAEQICTVASLTDIVLSHTPAHIALAALTLAARTSKQRELASSIIAKYLSSRVADARQRERLEEVVETVVLEIRGVTSLTIKRAEFQRTARLRDLCLENIHKNT